MPDIQLKMARDDTEVDEPKSMATKIQLWMNFIAQLTRKIENACDSKVQERVSLILNRISDKFDQFTIDYKTAR